MQPERPKVETILVADDDPQILALISRHLAREGYRVVQATDGQEALDRARTERPDIVLLDVLMPGMSGWEVARDMRRDPELKDTPIVFLTAIGQAVADATSPLFADGHLNKPFEMKELDDIIATTLKKRRPRSQG